MTRVNRTVSVVVALVLLVGGGLGLAMAGGALDDRYRQTRLLPSWLTRDWLDIDPAARAAILLAGGVLLMLLGLILVTAALRIDRIRHHEIGELLLACPPAQRGRTIVPAGILDRAVERDLTRHRAITKARIGLHRDNDTVAVRGVLQVATADGDLDPVRTGVAAAVQRLSDTTGSTAQPQEIELRLSPPAGS